MKLFQKYLILVLFFALTFNLGSVSAQTMSNSEFKLKINLLSTPKKNSSNNKENRKNSQTNVFIGPNYKVISGFQDDLSSATKPFIFSISQSLTDYGSLSPTTPVSRTNVLTVHNSFLNGYNVSAFQNHGLYSETSLSTIPDTTCDTGTCSEQNPAPWNNILTYGFGYRCDNISNTTACSNDFYDSKYYKHFANIANSQSPQIVMSGANIGHNKARIIYKVNISGAQPLGFYSNIITFVARANF